MKRCVWAETDNQLMQHYHDQEWGTPCHDDRKLFELLSLEIMQAGLSWQTILNKRAAFKDALADFDVNQLQHFEPQLPTLLTNAGIVRNRRKLLAIIHNAQVVAQLQAGGNSLTAYLWAFVNGAAIVHHYQAHDQIPSSDALAQKISRQLKQAGFQFTGPVVVYSWLQAAGLINDHELGCFRRAALLKKAQVAHGREA